MTFDPKHFLDLATILISDTKYCNEARCRTSISRAYYAAHLISRKKLELKGYSFSTDDKVHWKVIEGMIKENFVIGDMLKKLRKYRNDADYDLNKEITNYMTIYSKTLAEAVIEEANKI
ncbi:hypothetical protein METP3_03765 [Methanosarcinales archaeon]|nr:hypothetical protein METP3_03765 [Methanosarcinales archaeon]